MTQLILITLALLSGGFAFYGVRDMYLPRKTTATTTRVLTVLAVVVFIACAFGLMLIGLIDVISTIKHL